MPFYLVTRDGLYLQGPRTPAQVRKLGYGFTTDTQEAWTFPTAVKASAKLHAVALHMEAGHPRGSYPLRNLSVVQHLSSAAGHAAA